MGTAPASDSACHSATAPSRSGISSKPISPGEARAGEPGRHAGHRDALGEEREVAHAGQVGVRERLEHLARPRPLDRDERHVVRAQLGREVGGSGLCERA